MSKTHQRLIKSLDLLIQPTAPALTYYQIVYHVFKELGQEIDEKRIVESAIGIRRTVVWRKLFKFQHDGVIGAINKLKRFGGYIIDYSVDVYAALACLQAI